MAAFVVYHITSTQMIKMFNKESAAKRSRTCMNRNAGKDAYAVATMESYETDIVKMKKVKNLMTGEEVEIPSNTPRSCDPSSEMFWSM
jgi:hypothetical protein